MLIVFIMLLSFSLQAQTPCRDSLRLAMQHGRVLVRNVALRDSLLKIRLETINILKTQNLELQTQNDSLGKQSFVFEHKHSKVKKQRNILFGILLIATFILII